MSIRIKYFGMLTDITGKQEEVFDMDTVMVSDLMDYLIGKYPELQSKEFQVAVDQQIVISNIEINAIEVALLPPFSGG